VKLIVVLAELLRHVHGLVSFVKEFLDLRAIGWKCGNADTGADLCLVPGWQDDGL